METEPQILTACQVITAEAIAEPLLLELQRSLDALGPGTRRPTLVAFLANDDAAAVKYAEWTRTTCQANGFSFDLRKVDKNALEDEISQANADPAVDGMIVYYPIFPAQPTQDRYVQETVSLEKDVEGLCHRHLFSMYHNIRFLDPPHNCCKPALPCTPLAVVKILEHLNVYNTVLPHGNRLFGKTVTVINRSEVNGRPLAALLANDGALVYSVDLTGVQLFTRGKGIRQPRHQVLDQVGWSLEQCLPLSDVVISGVPAQGFKVPSHLIRDGAVCINFSSSRNFDVSLVKERASIYVPSIGKVTIAILLRNLVRLVSNRARTSGDAADVPGLH